MPLLFLINCDSIRNTLNKFSCGSKISTTRKLLMNPVNPTKMTNNPHVKNVQTVNLKMLFEMCLTFHYLLVSLSRGVSSKKNDSRGRWYAFLLKFPYSYIMV